MNPHLVSGSAHAQPGGGGEDRAMFAERSRHDSDGPVMVCVTGSVTVTPRKSVSPEKNRMNGKRSQACHVTCEVTINL